MAEGSPHPLRRATGVALAAALLAGAFYLASQERGPAPISGGAPGDQGPPAAVPPRAEAEPPAPPAPEVAPGGPAKPGLAAAPPAAEAPGLDLVRVEPDGSAAVAGTAEPGAKVTIMADAAPVAEAEADASGKFVAIFHVEPSAEPRALSLEAQPPGGGPATPSGDVVMLLPQAPAAAAADAARPAAVPPPESATPDGAPSDVAAVPASVPEDVPAPVAAAPATNDLATSAPAEAAPEPRVAATAIVRGDTVEVMPAEGAPKGLTLASISYSEAGEVSLAGRARAGAVLRAYVDDRFAEEARAGGDGRWQMDLGGVAGGIYRLRIDELGADGRVAGRVETPFQRDYPHAPPPRPGAPAGTDTGTVTVQPGNNLWTLARSRYGSGVMYTQIFTANREQIRDPDLIYPGQILSMPEQGAVE